MVNYQNRLSKRFNARPLKHLFLVVLTIWILNLETPINRSSIWCKNDSQISEDLEKWKAIADKIGNM